MTAITLEELVDTLVIAADEETSARLLVALAGPPGAGKSTIAERLVAQVNARAPSTAALLAMDGYHYDDRVLASRGDLPRKGAPHTFDVDGLAAMLDRLKASRDRDIAVPVFDRDLEVARAGAAIIPAEIRIVVVEGNYLLLDDPAWAPLRERFDHTVMLDVSEPVLVERLTNRWAGYGLEGDALVAKMEGNDLLNVKRVVEGSVPADYTLANG